MRTTAKGNIGRWSRVQARAQRKAGLARRRAAIDVNVANGSKDLWPNMTRSEIAALLHAWKKSNGMIGDGLRRARSADRARGRADQLKMEMPSGGPRWYWPVGELNSITRPSVRATAFEIPIASPIAMPWPVGRIAYGAFASMQSMHGD